MGEVRLVMRARVCAQEEGHVPVRIKRKVTKDRSSLRNFIGRCTTTLRHALLLPLHCQRLRLHHRRIAFQQLPCRQCHCLQQRAHAATAKYGTACGVGRRNKLP